MLIPYFRQAKLQGLRLSFHMAEVSGSMIESICRLLVIVNML